MSICKICDKKFEASRNSKGLYCSIQCAGVGNRTVKEVDCRFCSERFLPRWKSQKFCSQSCAATFNNKVGTRSRMKPQGKCDRCGVGGIRSGVKYCLDCRSARTKLCVCGKNMMADSPHETCHRCRNSENSQKAKDRKREREGRPPRNKNFWYPPVQDWIDGKWNGAGKNGLLNERVRKYLIEQAEHRCQSPACDVPGGFRTVHPITGRVPVEIEHINGDSTDHRPENLTVICPNCHALTSTYRALNKGSKRSWRRKSADGVDITPVV